MLRTGVAQLVERLRNKQEDGGSIPSPRTHAPRKIAVRFGERLGRPECPYLRRWVLDMGAFSLRVHHFYRSDDARAFHDHPWWFVTIVLKGGYTDVSSQAPDHLRPGSIRFRPALHRHTVHVDPGGVWTFVISGPLVRRWGFWVNGKFKKANKYFLEHGHHPCDQP